MASSSITYKDIKVSVKAIPELDAWFIRISVKGEGFTFAYTIDQPYKYTQERWLLFLEGGDYIGESPDDLMFHHRDQWVSEVEARAAMIDGEGLFDIRRKKSKYTFRRAGMASFRFDAGPLDICLRDIINKAMIMGFKFADE
jgi:hypothetical protein